MADEIKEEITEETEIKLDGPEGEETPTGEEEIPAGEEKPAGNDKESDGEGALQAELEALQEQTREQSRTISTLEKALTRLNDILVKAKLVEEEDPEAAAVAAEAEKTRDQQLATMLELMELNPKFQDVKQVVSRKRFDDIVEQLARVKVTKEGGRLVDRVVEIEDEIWGMTNPYRYMYGKIKEFHPDFAKPKSDEETPTDIHDIPGARSNPKAGAWTAAVIDALDESELDKVPADVYEKYLKNELQ